jgi:DNA-binding transcriptional ArsR family regulator
LETEEERMLGAVSLKLGQEKVRDQFAPSGGAEAVDPESFAGRLAAVASERRLSVLMCVGKRERTVSELTGLCGFDGATAAEDLELLRRHRLVERDRDGVWSLCCPSLAPSVERLVNVVLTTPAAKEAT